MMIQTRSIARPRAMYVDPPASKRMIYKSLERPRSRATAAAAAAKAGAGSASSSSRAKAVATTSTPPPTTPATEALKASAKRHLELHAAPAARALLEPYARAEADLAFLMRRRDLDALASAAFASSAAADDGGDGDSNSEAAAVGAALGRLHAAVARAMDAAYGPEEEEEEEEGSGGNGGCSGLFCSTASDAAFSLCDEPLDAFANSSSSSSNGEAHADSSAASSGSSGDDAAHLFLQRVLYRVNRLAHFWFDAPAAYANERSRVLCALRGAIERRWQRWELAQLPPRSLRAVARAAALCRRAGAEAADASSNGDGSATASHAAAAAAAGAVKRALRARFMRDAGPASKAAPPPGSALAYFRNEAGPNGYAHLLAIGAHDGLVEASRQSRVCAGVANRVSATVFRVLVDEYGGGHLARKHSTFYVAMLAAVGLEVRNEEEEWQEGGSKNGSDGGGDGDVEAYLDLAPWPALAGANNAFLCTERRRHYGRYVGALCQFEAAGPRAYRAYHHAARHCGLSAAAGGYWELHAREDERHGRQMLDGAALPLVDMHPAAAWEVLLGYEMEAALSARAGAAVAVAVRAAEDAAAAVAAVA